MLTDFGISHNTDRRYATSEWVSVLCPHCSHTSEKGAFHSSGKAYSCWRCGRHGVLDTLALMIQMPVGAVFNVIKQYSDGLRPQKKIEDIHRPGKIILPGGELQWFHKEYLERRGFDPEYLEMKYKLKGTGILDWYAVGEEQASDYSGRVIVPIFDSWGDLISFQGRAISKYETLRWKGLSPKASVKNYKHTFYNIQNVRGGTVLVLEGVADVWRMGDNAICSFGTDLTTQQLYILSEYDNVYFMFDNEDLAQSKAKKYAKTLATMGVYVENLRLKNYNDCADMPQEEADKLKVELRL